MKETDIIDPVRIGKFSLGYFQMVCDGPYIPTQTFLEILHQTSI